MSSNTIILVPARFNSSRYPGKPLEKIFNKPMIDYVVENCQKTSFDYAVVTDDDRIESHLKSIGANVVRVDDDVPTGSERIALAFERFFSDKNYEYIVNVQGDEPLLKSNTIEEIGKSHKNSNFDIFTAIRERSSTENDFENPNVVKCVYSKNSSQCLYFSRESIPYSRDKNEFSWFQHIGVYSYKVEALSEFVKLEMSQLENLEKLEQLRAIENGMTIGASIVDVKLIGVDTPEDIKKIEDALNE